MSELVRAKKSPLVAAVIDLELWSKLFPRTNEMMIGMIGIENILPVPIISHLYFP
jgi:hypothetical protein